ncbi:hypothetical protein GCM10020258_34940 [Sphingomonas yabuuchiae]
MATIAFAAFGLSYWMRSGLNTQAGFSDFVLPLMVQGIAMSTFFLAMLTIALDGVPQARIPSATGISNFAQITAGSFAASLTTTMWDRREAMHQAHLSEAIGQGPVWQMAKNGLNHLGLTDVQAAAAVTRQMVGQAYLLASTDIFYVSAWLCIVLAGLTWFTRRPKPHDGPIAAD